MKQGFAKRLIYLVIGCVALVTLDWIFPFAWISLPIKGVVEDRTTRQPIGGAIVGAAWEVQGGLEKTHIGAVFAEEVRTDTSGHFTLPGWGPRFKFGWGSIYDSEPFLFVFRPGYLAFPEQTRSGRFRRNPILVSASVQIELQPVEDKDGYAMNLAGLAMNLRDKLQRADPCYWGLIAGAVGGIEKASIAIRGMPAGGLFGPLALMPPSCTTIQKIFGASL